VIAASSAGTCGAHKGAPYRDGHIKCDDNPSESSDVAGRSRCFLQGNPPSRRQPLIAAVLCDLEGSASAGTRQDAQTMQRGCSTGAREAASRVFNVERIAASTASL